MEEKLSTWTEKIMERTLSRMKERTEGMVKTSYLTTVMERLEQGATWLTIKGSSGEGKSTVALMALEELHKTGREVFQVVSPEEFSGIVRTCSRPVFMLDDVFGDVKFDKIKYREWSQAFWQLPDVSGHRSDWQKTALKQRTVTVLFVGNETVLSVASTKRGRLSHLLKHDLHVINMSGERDIHEKVCILKSSTEPKGIQLSDSEINQICTTQSNYGFCYACQLFVLLKEKDSNISAETFFQNPLNNLDIKIANFLTQTETQTLFQEMLKGEGKASVEVLESGGLLQTANGLVGTFLRKEDGYLLFAHPVIFDCVEYNLCKSSTLFVIQNCELGLIHRRLQFKTAHDSQAEIPYKPGLVVHIASDQEEDLARRFAAEITKGNYLQVLSHQACSRESFVGRMMGHIVIPLTELVKTYHSDGTSDSNFLSLIASSKSPEILKYVLHRTDVLHSEDMRDNVLFGVCRYAASDVLTYLLQTCDSLDINATYGYYAETPLMIAAQSEDSQFVEQVMLLKPDLNASDMYGKTVCEYLCEYGHLTAVQKVFDSGTIEKMNSEYFDVILGFAFENNQDEMIDFLVEKGASVDSALRYSLQYLDISRTERFVEAGADINKRGIKGCTPLHLVSCTGSTECTHVLLKAGAYVNAQDDDGYTPLHRTASWGEEICMRTLLKAGADVTVQDEEGNTPLHVFTEEKCLGLLLMADAEVNAENLSGYTPLHHAAKIGSRTCIEALLTRGANVHAQTKDLVTPLHTSAKEGSAECVDVLLDAGADVNIRNEDGLTPLFTSVRHGKDASLCALLKAGSDVSIQITGGFTPLHLSSLHADKIILKILLEAEADVNIQSDEGFTPLHEATGLRYGDGSIDSLIMMYVDDEEAINECVQILLDAGANVNAQSKDGFAPLHNAVRRGSTESVAKLLIAGAEVNLQTIKGVTALHIGAKTGSTECVDLLLKARPDLNAHCDNGNTALHFAIEAESTECTALLLKAGTSLNVQNVDGYTPLLTAMKNGTKPLVDMLLEAGADVNSTDRQGMTLLHNAVYRRSANGLLDVPDVQECERLIRHGTDVNKQDSQGNTPLHLLCQVSKDDPVDIYQPPSPASASAEIYRTLIKLMVSQGADMNILNIRGQPALHGWCKTLAEPEKVVDNANMRDRQLGDIQQADKMDASSDSGKNQLAGCCSIC